MKFAAVCRLEQTIALERDNHDEYVHYLFDVCMFADILKVIIFIWLLFKCAR